MELNLNVLGKQQTEATTGTKQMRMSDHAQSMVFQMFTKNVYSNPIGTVVREITSNCFDSHVEAGVKNTPVLIKKTYDNQTDTQYISFIDYGVGMSPDRVENIYGVYFESTKRGTNDEIGGFGIGGKTPLAYRRYTGEGDGEYDNSFFVITNYNGVKYYYTVFEGKESPEYSLFHSENTDERNGTEIRIPVLRRDVDKFEDELIRQLYYFEGIVFEGFSDRIENNYQIVRGKNFLYRGTEVDRHIHVCLGKVYYPIDFSVLNLPSYDYQIPIAIDVPIGKIGVTVSRENLDYSEQTIIYLKQRINDTIDELKTMLEDQYDNIQTLEDYFKLKENFGILKLTDHKSINIKGLIKPSEIDLTKFKYSAFKTPSSGVLFELFFNVKTYGQKETIRGWNDRFERLKRNYEGILKIDNIFYSDDDNFKIKRIKQSYLKSEYGRFYLIRKNNLVSKWKDICDVFNVHFDTMADFTNSNTFKTLLEMQEEYYEIVRNNATEYENVEVPEDFKTNYGKPKLTSDLLKTTIPVKLDNRDKERVKIKDLVDFNGKIFYGTPDDDNLANTWRSLFETLYGYDKLADSYNRFHSTFGSKKNVMIITVAKNNLKYMKYCKKAYPITQFYHRMIQRKEDQIIEQIKNTDIVDNYNNIDRFYKSDVFKEISPIWKNRVEKVESFLETMNIYYTRIINYKTLLSNYIDFNNVQQTGEEKVVRKHIEGLEKMEAINYDTLDLIRIPYNVEYMNENKKQTLIQILKSVMSFD